jgi:uncharacterized repeat protein (TIGR01451 family)
MQMNVAMPPVRFSSALGWSFALALLARSAVAAPSAPDMTIFVGNSPGTFKQGDVGDSYQVTASNSGNKASTGTVTVVNSVSSGLTVTNIAGSGWTCTLGTPSTCTRSDALAASTNYPVITVTVNVAGNAPTTVTDTATVSGGGESNTGNDSSSDPTSVTQLVPDLSADIFNSGTWSEGDVGDIYNIRIDNSNTTGASTDGSTVTVVATVTSGLTPTAISGTGWNCTLGGPTPLTCTRNDVLTNHTTYPWINLTVNVARNATTPQTGSATVSGGGDQNTVNNNWSDITTIVQKPDLTIAKSHSGTWNLGAVGKTYTLTVSNVGGIATDGSTVTVIDTLPAGLTATAIAGTGWSCTLGTLTCTRSDALANAASYAPITVTVDVANNAPANITNTATVSGGGQTYTADDTATDPTQTNQTDLVLVKTHSGTWNPGDTGKTYSLVVSNVGAIATDGSLITVVDTLPAGLSATAMSGTGWSCTVGTLTCTRSNVLAANSSYPVITLTVDVANNATTPVTNTATVAGGGELDTSNDGASDITTINEADLTISMFLGSLLSQGQTFASYFISVHNSGTAATSGLVTVVDTLPTGLTATNINGGGWSCTLATLTCTRSDALAGGANYPAINLFVSVDHDAPVSVTNTVTVSGGGEINTANDSASKTSPVIQRADLSIDSSHSGTWHQGDFGRTYALSISNVGFADTSATTVTVVDTLPAGLTATAIAGTGWSCTLGTLTCTRTDVLVQGASYPDITVTVDVDSNAAALVTNAATVSGGGEIYAPNDNASDDTTISSAGPGIDLIMQMDDGTNGKNFFAGGQLAHYTITVQNIGTVDAHNASVQDSVPANLLSASWICNPAGGASCTNGSGDIVDTVDIPQGTSVTYQLTATVQALAEFPVINTATVATAGGEVDINPSNNGASATDAVGIFAEDFEGP